MIFVDRREIPVPSILGTEGRRQHAEALAFYAIALERRRQQRFPFRVHLDAEVGEALRALFRDKCAFCESPEGLAGDLKVMHLRPADGVVRPDGELLPDHYWWLASEWDNLYLACGLCRRRFRPGGGKGARFPLEDELARAPLGATGAALADERPLLLDPCNEGPERHLVFLDDGGVAASTARGLATIELVGLDRAQLVGARAEVVGALRARFERLDRLRERAGVDGRAARTLRHELAALRQEHSPSQPYAGLRRQFVAAFLEGFTSPGDDVALAFETPAPTAADKTWARRRQRRYASRQEDYSLVRFSPEDLERYRSVTRRVERVVIRNVKAIREADLDLTRSRARTAPWTVLLGENGSGKSTVLQALAIAVAGREALDGLGIDPASLVRRAPNVRRGTIEVWLSGSRHRRRVEITADGFAFHGAEEPPTLVLGYGETRLLPGPGLEPARGAGAARVDGLFRPARALVDAEGWLLGTDEATFDHVAGGLKEMLGLAGETWLARDAERVWVHEAAGRMPLAALSTGYQSVVATVIDLLELTMQVWPTPGSAEAVVLLDEIGAHLHPKWRMQVVKGLRTLLPAAQFVVTTHEPLCLRGLADGEVVLMQRDPDGRAVAVEDLPSPEGLRVDQLLTSRHFGLDTTLDPDLDRLFDEYYQLLSRPEDQLPEDRRARRRELAEQLQGVGVLGYTRRDQLVYEAIDEYLAAVRRVEEQGGREEELTPRRRETLDRVQRLWLYAQESEGVR